MLLRLAVRLAPLAALAALLAACGGTVVAPLPQTVVGPVPKEAGQPVGHPAAGKAVFVESGCGSCHTFKAAGANGTVGPSLDDLASYAKHANQPVADFARSAIASPPAPYVPPGFPTNAMPTTFGSTLSPQQLADLVAFLTAGA